MISPANTYTGLTKPTPDKSEPDKYYPTGERNYARVIVTDVQQGQAGASYWLTRGRRPSTSSTTGRPTARVLPTSSSRLPRTSA